MMYLQKWTERLLSMSSRRPRCHWSLWMIFGTKHIFVHTFMMSTSSRRYLWRTYWSLSATALEHPGPATRLPRCRGLTYHTTSGTKLQAATRPLEEPSKYMSNRHQSRTGQSNGRQKAINNIGSSSTKSLGPSYCINGAENATKNDAGVASLYHSTPIAANKESTNGLYNAPYCRMCYTVAQSVTTSRDPSKSRVKSF